MAELVKSCAYAVVMLAAGIAVFICCVPRRQLRLLWPAIVVTIGLGIPAAFLATSVTVYNWLALLLVPLAARSRQQVVPTYLFALLLLPAAATPLEAGGVYFLSIDTSIALGLGALLATVLRPAPRSEVRLVQDLPALAIMLVLFAIAARETSVTNLLRSLLEATAYFLLPYLVIRRGMRTRAEIDAALLAVVAATTALAVLAAYEAWAGWPLFWPIWEHLGATIGPASSVKLRAGMLRSPGPIGEPTAFAFCLMAGMLLAMTMRRLFRSRDRQAVVVAILAVGTLAPQSRGAWLGAGVGLIASLCFTGRWHQVARLGGLGLIAGIVLLAIAPGNGVVATFLGLNAEGADTVNYRRSLLGRGLEEVAKYPLLGDSPTNVLRRMADMKQGEGIVDFVNTYLYLALTAGLIGMALFAAALLVPATGLWSRRRALRSSPAGAAFFGLLTAMLVAFAFTSFGGRPANLLAVVLASAAVLVARPRTRAMPAIARHALGEPVRTAV